jgi:hypothetical protein
MVDLGLAKRIPLTGQIPVRQSGTRVEQEEDAYQRCLAPQE